MPRGKNTDPNHSTYKKHAKWFCENATWQVAARLLHCSRPTLYRLDATLYKPILDALYVAPPFRYVPFPPGWPKHDGPEWVRKCFLEGEPPRQYGSMDPKFGRAEYGKRYDPRSTRGINGTRPMERDMTPDPVAPPNLSTGLPQRMCTLHQHHGLALRETFAVYGGRSIPTRTQLSPAHYHGTRPYIPRDWLRRARLVPGPHSKAVPWYAHETLKGAVVPYTMARPWPAQLVRGDAVALTSTWRAMLLEIMLDEGLTQRQLLARYATIVEPMLHAGATLAIVTGSDTWRSPSVLLNSFRGTVRRFMRATLTGIDATASIERADAALFGAG